MGKYIEHEKLKSIQIKSEFIGDFLSWLEENNYQICKLGSIREIGGRFEVFEPQIKNKKEWLASFLDIDLIKLEQEKEEMYLELKKLNQVQ